MDIPSGKNLTVFKLRTILSNAGISYPKKARKSELVSIFNNAAGSPTENFLDALKNEGLVEVNVGDKRKRSGSPRDELVDPIPNKKKRTAPPEVSMTPPPMVKKQVAPLNLAESPIAPSPDRQLRDSTLTTPMPAQTSKKTADLFKKQLRKPTPVIKAPPVTTKTTLPPKTSIPVKVNIQRAKEPETWPEQPRKATSIIQGFFILAVWIAVIYAFTVTFFLDSYPVRRADGIPFKSTNELVGEKFAKSAPCPTYGICENGWLTGCQNGYNLKSSILACVPELSENGKNALRSIGKRLTNNKHCPNDEIAISANSIKEEFNLSFDEFNTLIDSLSSEPISYSKEDEEFRIIPNAKLSCRLFEFVKSNAKLLISLLAILVIGAFQYHKVLVNDASRVHELRGAMLSHIMKANGERVSQDALREIIQSDHPGLYEAYFWNRATSEIANDERVISGEGYWHWA